MLLELIRLSILTNLQVVKKPSLGELAAVEYTRVCVAVDKGDMQGYLPHSLSPESRNRVGSQQQAYVPPYLNVDEGLLISTRMASQGNNKELCIP